MTRKTRRTLLEIAAAAFLLPLSAAQVHAEEPFPVFKSDSDSVPRKFWRRVVPFETQEPPGTIVVDPQRRFLYFVQPGGNAIRYGIGVGKGAKDWRGVATIHKKAAWPTWTPTADMLARSKIYAKWAQGMPGGTGNPLGARALYLLNNGVDNQIRIHGTPEPWSIGKTGTAGCFRMLNSDVVELYDLVDTGTRVVVLEDDPSRVMSLWDLFK